MPIRGRVRLELDRVLALVAVVEYHFRDIRAIWACHTDQHCVNKFHRAAIHASVLVENGEFIALSMLLEERAPGSAT